MQLLIEKDTNIVKFWLDDQFKFYFGKDKIICTRDKKVQTNDYVLMTKSMYNDYFTLIDESHDSEDNQNLEDIKKDRLNSFAITHFKNKNTNKLIAVNTNNIEVIQNAPPVPKFIKIIGWNSLKFIDGKYEVLFDPTVKKIESMIKDINEENSNISELNFEFNLKEKVYLFRDLYTEAAAYLKNNKSSAPTIKKIANEMEKTVKEIAESICNIAIEAKDSCIHKKKEIEELELEIKEKRKHIEYFNEHQVEPET